MDVRQGRSAKKSLITPRSQIARRSSSLGTIRSSLGVTTGRSSRSAWTPATSATRSRRSSSASQVDRLSQGAPRQANLKDQRPFQDKAFVAESVEKLYAFLQEQSYPHHTTQQLLTRMSTREFENVFTFLMKFLEPNFAVGRGSRLEDVVLEQLRLLRYPYPLHKSMLMGIGSQPHKALAIITWLADLVKYHVSLSPLDDFFSSPDLPFGSPGSQQCGDGSMGNLLRFMLDKHDDDTDVDDEELDALVLEMVGPVEPIDDLEKKLAEQDKELQRLTAALELHEMRKADLQMKKKKIENYNTYFKEMAAHCEARSAEVAKNEERLVALNAEKQLLKEQLAEAQALQQEQRLRQEDEETLQERDQRLQQDITSARSQLEALKGQYQLSNIEWYNASEMLRQEQTKAQERFKRCASHLSDVIPRAVLDDFDLRPIEDARSLHRHQVTNAAATAEVFRLLDEAKEKLLGCIRQDKELCEQYSFDVESLERELKLKQELLSMRESYHTEQMAEQREKARELDEQYAVLCKQISDLQQKIDQAQRKAMQEAEKRLAEAEQRLSKTVAHRKEAMAASDKELAEFEALARATIQEHIDIVKECHDKVIDAIEELHKIKL
ncbi:uncharacterized protein LOC144136583 [Amblyomma americanum]